MAQKGRTLQLDRPLQEATAVICPPYAIGGTRQQGPAAGMATGRFAFAPSGRRAPHENPNLDSRQVGDRLGTEAAIFSGRQRPRSEMEPLQDAGPAKPPRHVAP